MSIRVSLIFPYSVSKTDEDVFEKLEQIISKVRDRNAPLHRSKKSPVLVINMDTFNRGMYDAFVQHMRDVRKLEDLNAFVPLKIWSVDTCQMWLSGFGKILDDNVNDPEPGLCVLQIPGDMKHIQDFDTFIERLYKMTAMVER